jgi:hypothetical protein
MPLTHAIAGVAVAAIRSTSGRRRAKRRRM